MAYNVDKVAMEDAFAYEAISGFDNEASIILIQKQKKERGKSSENKQEQALFEYKLYSKWRLLSAHE